MTPMGLGLGLGFGSQSSTPFPSIANLKLRLESDLGVSSSGGRVTDWLDQKQSIDFAAAGSARPSLINSQVNGHPAIRFDGIANSLDTASLVSDLLGAGHPGAYKVIAVLKNNSAVAHDGASYNEPAILCDSASFFAGLAADSTRIDTGFYQGPDHEVSIVQATGALVYVEATLTTAAGGTLSLQVGTGGTPSSSTGVGTLGGAAGFLKIGRNYADAKFWQGDLFALYVATTMTSDEVTALRTYLNSKYGPGL